MTDFLKELPKVFRKRYLRTHDRYLKDLADIISTMYHISNWEQGSNYMTLKLLDQEVRLDEKRKDPEHETLEFRDLRNCWYHECALHHPFTDLDDRLRFASWKIIQCYYSVFSAIASLVCCYHPPQKSPMKTLNIYGREFLCNRRRRNFLLPPVNLYLNQQGKIPSGLLEMITWQYAHEHKIPTVIKCLRSVHIEKTITTIPHYLKSLREWVTYEDAYLMFRLHGETIKANLDFSLKRIAFIHCLQTEFYLINLFGWDSVKRQYDTFTAELERNLKTESPTLLARFDAYQSSGLLD